MVTWVSRVSRVAKRLIKTSKVLAVLSFYFEAIDMKLSIVASFFSLLLVQSFELRGMRLTMMSSAKKGVGFNYDPTNYRDSNSGNYRRLSDQLAARKAEEEQKLKEREELIRKEKMQEMMKQREDDIFFNTPGDKIVADSQTFYVSNEILQILADLDEQLIGLRPVKDKLRRYASLMITNKIRE